MRHWKYRLAMLAACASSSALSCSGDKNENSQADVQATGGTNPDDPGPSTPGEVRDLSGNCQGPMVEEGATCSVSGLFCRDEAERRCVCGGFSTPTETNQDQDGGRRGTRRPDTSTLSWVCLGDLPLGGASSAMGGASSSADGGNSNLGQGGARR